MQQLQPPSAFGDVAPRFELRSTAQCCGDLQVQADGMETASWATEASLRATNGPARKSGVTDASFAELRSCPMPPPRETGRTQIMNRNFAGLGRPAHAWRNWPGFNTLAVIAPEILVPEGYRAVIVAPRADDETLGLSGLISRLITVSRPILLVAATDRGPGSVVPSRSKALHRATEWLPEPLRALRGFSGARSTVLRTGLQEGELPAVEDDLEWRLRGLILPSDIVFASWRYDGHPDYEATGRVAARACAALFAPLVEVPVWTWLWSIPGDRRIPWLRARRIFLDRAAVARQQRALVEYRARSPSGEGRTRGASSAAGENRPHEIVFV